MTDNEEIADDVDFSHELFNTILAKVTKGNDLAADITVLGLNEFRVSTRDAVSEEGDPPLHSPSWYGATARFVRDGDGRFARVKSPVGGGLVRLSYGGFGDSWHITYMKDFAGEQDSIILLDDFITRLGGLTQMEENHYRALGTRTLVRMSGGKIRLNATDTLEICHTLSQLAVGYLAYGEAGTAKEFMFPHHHPSF